MLTKKYKNKYFSILGDSISTLEGYSVPKGAAFYDKDYKRLANVWLYADTWWGQVLDALGAELLVNNSISGSTVAWHPALEWASYASSDERTSALHKGGVSPDVIVLFIGINDWGAGVPLTEEFAKKYSAASCEPRAMFDFAYAETLRKLRVNYPKAEIWCFTLPIGRRLVEKNFEYEYYRNGVHIAEFCNVIRTCAEKYGCRTFDLYYNEQPYDSLEGYHPTAIGMRTLSASILDKLTDEE